VLISPSLIVNAGYTPHMTMGNRILTQERASALISQWKKTWKPITFTVSELYLIAREKGKRFEISHAIPLGKGANMSLEGTLSSLGSFEPAARASIRQQAIDLCDDICLTAVQSALGMPTGHLFSLSLVVMLTPFLST